jgi:hypothetical protein
MSGWGNGLSQHFIEGEAGAPCYQGQPRHPNIQIAAITLFQMNPFLL